jgi:asparagine synthase (glutamine-hydrolysing)
MTRTLAHRGPDDEGFWVDDQGEAALGFRRLSILDLSPMGHQPMASVDGRYVVIFNGEIYNFGALRAELSALGDTFRGHSDTEVMLAAFSRFGVAATIPRLWGMFAIAAWDVRERELHLVRDRLGKKPLYFGWQGETFLFGSELKALRAHPAFTATLDRDSLASYLRYSYVPAPRSIYEGIHKLRPGTRVVIRPDRPGEILSTERYWDPVEVARRGIQDPLVLPDGEATDALETLLLDAVKLRMYADVPLGAFLSGGIDSSTVVALMQAQATGPVRTFTIGFDAAAYDESGHARAVAAHLGTDHTELLLSPEETRAVVPRLPTLYDEPFADVSQIPTFLVAQLARTSVTVALSGDGGDEVFGGYRRYVAGSRLWSRVASVPTPVRSAAAAALSAVAPGAWDTVGAVADRLLPTSRSGLVDGNRVGKLASVLDVASVEELYLRLTSTWLQPERLLIRGAEQPTNLPDQADGFAAPPLRMMLADLQSYLPDDILTKVDRATMGTSLEARAPLLDHRVVEFAWRLPLGQKIRSGEGKFLLRRLLERHVPRAMTNRPKQGFGVPIDSWLRGPLRDWAQDLLSESRLLREGFLRPEPIQAALTEHLGGRRNRQHQLWNVLMFEAWLDDTAAPPGSA